MKQPVFDKETVSKLRVNIDGIERARQRLRKSTQAISSRLLETDADAIGIETVVQRTRDMSNAMDATLGMMQQRVIQDVSSALDHLDALHHLRKKWWKPKSSTSNRSECQRRRKLRKTLSAGDVARITG